MKLPCRSSARSWIVSLALAALLGSGLAGAAPADPAGGTGGGPLAGSLTVRVVESGTTNAIGGAWVMVGPAEDDPFAGNVAFTDGTGAATFSNAALSGTVTVTAGDVGRAYTTVYGLGVDEVVLPLRSLSPPPSALAGDEFLGIGVNNGIACLGDGNADIGLVLTSLTGQEVLEGAVTNLLSQTSAPMATPLGAVDVPDNVYVPTQCELFQTFEKLTYHMRIPTGRRTVYGLSARAPLGALFEPSSIPVLVEQMSIREFDILRDRIVSVDENTYDLDAFFFVQNNLTVDVSNGRPGTDVVAAGLGRLTAADLSEEWIVTGADAFDSDLSAGTASLTLGTRPATGELSDMIHGAIVMQLLDEKTTAISLALQRSGFVPPATLNFSSFYEVPVIQNPDNKNLSWQDVTSATSPPDRHVNSGRIVYRTPGINPDDPAQQIVLRTTLWVLQGPGSQAGFSLPVLPPSAPQGLPDPDATIDQDRLDFALTVQFVGDQPGGFDYGAFAFSDLGDFTTHASLNDRPLRCRTTAEVSGLLLARGAASGEVVLDWQDSPDVCHDTESGRGYEVWAAEATRPGTEPGAWPFDPAFQKRTDEELDGDLTDSTFTHAPVEGTLFYVVVDRGLDEQDGPAGHYGN